MALKDSMNILLEDMKKQDAVIKADMQSYATMLRNIEIHSVNLYQRETEKELFETAMRRIGGKDAAASGSIHSERLQDRITAEQQEITKNRTLIAEQEEYFKAIETENHEKLWAREDDKCALAGIYFAFANWKENTAKLVENLIKTRSKNSEAVTKYFLEKALIESDRRKENDEECEQLDRLLSEMISRSGYAKAGVIWQNADEALSIRRTERTQSEFNRTKKRYQEMKEQFTLFEQNYAETNHTIAEALKGFTAQKGAKNVKIAIDAAKEWHHENKAALDKEIKVRKNESSRIDTILESLAGMEQELQTGLEHGLTSERCDEIRNMLTGFNREANEFVPVSKLDRKRNELFYEYKKQVNKINSEVNVALASATEAETTRIRNKENRKRILLKLIPFAIVGVILLILFRIFCSNVYYGTEYYFGNNLYKNYRVADGVETIPYDIFKNNQSMETITLPESLTEIQARAFIDCTSLKTVVLPQNISYIGGSAFRNCTSLETVEFQSSEIDLQGEVFENCGSLKEIRNTGNILNLEEELVDNIRNCCNLDMSDKYDDLYTNAIVGIPLLENEAQLKNMLDNKWLAISENSGITVDTTVDKFKNLKTNAEVINTYNRETEFTFDMEKFGIDYKFAGTVRAEDAEYALETDIRCEGADISKVEEKLRNGDQTAILGLLDGQVIQVDGLDVTIHADEITILESAVMEESETKICIPVKVQVNKPLGELVFMGTILLAENNNYYPRLIQEEAAMVESINLLGSYVFVSDEGTTDILTVDRRYDSYYSVTRYGEGNMLRLDASERFGDLISMWDEETGSIVTYVAEIDSNLEGLWINGYLYRKVDDTVIEKPMEEMPLIGIWEGTYPSGSTTERYILPIGENTIGAVDITVSDSDNITIAAGIMHIEEENQNSAIFEFKEWVKGEGNYLNEEWSINESYTTANVDSSSEYSFILSKKNPANDVNYTDTESWTIYNGAGEVKEELYTINESVPQDAFAWNGSSYYLYSNCNTWEEAKEYCESVGGHLAMITSAEENEAVYSYLLEQGYTDAFFGATDAPIEGIWKWADEQSMEYANWHKGEPNSESNGEDYAMFYYKFGDGTWNDSAFGSGALFICEWD